MIAVIALVLGILLYLFSNTIFAKSYGASICKQQPYSCYITKRGDTWEKLFPNPNQQDLVMRLNRMNTRLRPGMQIAIPTQSNLGILDIAPFKQQISPPGEKVIFISLKELAWGAYEPDGTLRSWGPVSGGRGFCPDVNRGCRTPAGQFAVYRKQGSGCISTKFPIPYGGAPMPYCMFFHGGFALHGSYEVPGYNASHGCVRLFINDARWLNEEFTEGEANVAVYIDR